MRSASSFSRGKVYIVGAGPGDPELLTVKARRLIDEADVIVYDRLIGDEIIALLPEHKERIDVGKEPKGKTSLQEEINKILVQKALEGKTVVRLKGGDPFIFGRGGEEAEELARHGIQFEVVPGVTSATAAPAYSGIPLTHRDHSSLVAIITGHKAEEKEREPIDWNVLGKLKGTLVIMMGVGTLEENLKKLAKGGMSPDTPAAIVEKGTLKDQRVLIGTLADIAKKAKDVSVEPPAVLVLGDVVKLHEIIGELRR